MQLVPMPAVDRDDVLAALQDFASRGRDAVLADLANFGFKASRDYFVSGHGVLYDSKPVVALAARHRTGETPRDSDFDGGDSRTAQQLRALGFTVTAPGPPWDWEELVLACDVLAAHGWREVSSAHSDVAELSVTLRRLSEIPAELRSPRFRSAGSVSRKMADIATSAEGYSGIPTRGNRLDREVANAYRVDPAGMHDLAEQLRYLATIGTPVLPDPDLDLDTADHHVATSSDADLGASANEGRRILAWRVSRERDPALRRKKIRATLNANLPVACEICGFDFGSVYGARGQDYIEVHHRTPLHVSGATTTTLEDLALLCSNCHRMIHRGVPWLTTDELLRLVRGGHTSA